MEVDKLLLEIIHHPKQIFLPLLWLELMRVFIRRRLTALHPQNSYGSISWMNSLTMYGIHPGLLYLLFLICAVHYWLRSVTALDASGPKAEVLIMIYITKNWMKMGISPWIAKE